MKEKNQEIEAYTKLLMKCVTEKDCFDESLVSYLLNYKRELIEGDTFIKRESSGVTKGNLWGYIKNESKTQDLEKWAKLLNKDINDEPSYQYIKFNFHDYEKRKRNAKYKPLYFKGYGTSDHYVEVSQYFLNIVQEDYEVKKINPEKLSETELKLIINDLLHDNNIRDHFLSRKENYNQLIDKLSNYIVENYEEMEKLAKDDKKSIIRMIAMGDNTINHAFQNIQGEKRDNFIKQYDLEEKYLTYMRYTDIGKDFLIHFIYTYKDKDFWIKELNCYSKKENTFSIRNAIKDLMTMSNGIDYMYETGTHKIHDWNTAKFTTQVDTNLYGNKYQRVLQILEFFKEELKGATNYKEEMEKLMIVAIADKNEHLFKTVKKFMQKENGYQEEMIFNNIIYKEVSNAQKDFMLEMKKKEVKELNDKLSNKLEEKGIKEKKLKI